MQLSATSLSTAPLKPESNKRHTQISFRIIIQYFLLQWNQTSGPPSHKASNLKQAAAALNRHGTQLM